MDVRDLRDELTPFARNTAVGIPISERAENKKPNNEMVDTWATRFSLASAVGRVLTLGPGPALICRQNQISMIVEIMKGYVGRLTQFLDQRDPT